MKRETLDEHIDRVALAFTSTSRDPMLAPRVRARIERSRGSSPLGAPTAAFAAAGAVLLAVFMSTGSDPAIETAQPSPLASRAPGGYVSLARPIARPQLRPALRTPEPASQPVPASVAVVPLTIEAIEFDTVSTPEPLHVDDIYIAALPDGESKEWR